MTESVDYDAGLNLDLDFIDYPTGWAIQKANGYGLGHWQECSAKQTNGALLCDCTGLVYQWADLKWKHERAKADAALGRVREAIEREHARGCADRHQQGESDECCSCAAARIEEALDGRRA